MALRVVGALPLRVGAEEGLGWGEALEKTDEVGPALSVAVEEGVAQAVSVAVPWGDAVGSSDCMGVTELQGVGVLLCDSVGGAVRLALCVPLVEAAPEKVALAVPLARAVTLAEAETVTEAGSEEVPV